MKWRQEYQHPLMIPSSTDRLDLASTNGVEVKNLEEVKTRKGSSEYNSENAAKPQISKEDEKKLKELIFNSSGVQSFKDEKRSGSRMSTNENSKKNNKQSGRNSQALGGANGSN